MSFNCIMIPLMDGFCSSVLRDLGGRGLMQASLFFKINYFEF